MYIIPSLEKLEKRTLLSKYFCDEPGLPHSAGSLHYRNAPPLLFESRSSYLCNRAIIEILLCLMILRIAQVWFIKCNFNFDDCHLKGGISMRRYYLIISLWSLFSFIPINTCVIEFYRDCSSYSIFIFQIFISWYISYLRNPLISILIGLISISIEII